LRLEAAQQLLQAAALQELQDQRCSGWICSNPLLIGSLFAGNRGGCCKFWRLYDVDKPEAGLEPATSALQERCSAS
jgi:hypothetical protein